MKLVCRYRHEWSGDDYWVRTLTAIRAALASRSPILCDHLVNTFKRCVELVSALEPLLPDYGYYTRHPMPSRGWWEIFDATSGLSPGAMGVSLRVSHAKTELRLARACDSHQKDLCMMGSSNRVERTPPQSRVLVDKTKMQSEKIWGVRGLVSIIEVRKKYIG